MSFPLGLKVKSSSSNFSNHEYKMFLILTWKMITSVMHIARIFVFQFCIFYYIQRMFLFSFSIVIWWTYHFTMSAAITVTKIFRMIFFVSRVFMVALMIFFFFSKRHNSKPTFRNPRMTKCCWSINSRWLRGWIWDGAFLVMIKVYIKCAT